MKNILAQVKEQYKQGNNIIKYLKEIENRTTNSFEDIMISYDFQAGTYVDYYNKNKESKKFREEIADTINRYVANIDNPTIFEPGCGEATTLYDICTYIREHGKENSEMLIYALDASFSRLMVAKRFLAEKGFLATNLMMGNMLELPIADNSCDVVYTVHACEPNGGNEEKLLKELYRVTKKYLILFEPAYDLAGDEAKRRMEEHGYAIRLFDTIQKMGLDVREHRLLENRDRITNPTGVTVIEKHETDNVSDFVVADPISKGKLQKHNNILHCEDSMLIYPIMDDIMCLNEDSAIIATKFSELYNK